MQTGHFAFLIFSPASRRWFPLSLQEKAPAGIKSYLKLHRNACPLPLTFSWREHLKRLRAASARHVNKVSVWLNKEGTGPGLTHAKTTDYSVFVYFHNVVFFFSVRFVSTEKWMWCYPLRTETKHVKVVIEVVIFLFMFDGSAVFDFNILPQSRVKHLD